MSLVVSDEGFVEALKNISEFDGFRIPEGMTKEQATLMTRCMQANEASELNDITDEQIIDLFNHISAYSECLKGDHLFSNNGTSFAFRLAKISSFGKRRVL